MDVETLCRKLLDEIYAGAFSGTPAMIVLEDEIRTADAERLAILAAQFGIRQ